MFAYFDYLFKELDLLENILFFLDFNNDHYTGTSVTSALLPPAAKTLMLLATAHTVDYMIETSHMVRS